MNYNNYILTKIINYLTFVLVWTWEGRDPTLHTKIPPSGYQREAPWHIPESF